MPRAHFKQVEVRRQIRPGNDLRVVAVDFSGIQARNVAMESRDPTLVDAFWNNYNIHKEWAIRAAQLYPKWLKGGSLKDEDTLKKYRQIAKSNFVFATFFGAQAKKISSGMGIPLPIAEQLLEEFWGKFPRIKKWHERLSRDYYKYGYVTGLSGFRRHAPVAVTEIINTPIQSDESLIVCSAMNRLSEMDDDRFQANMEIHDDLIFIWPKHEIEKNIEVVVKEMTRIAFPWINVPLEVEVSIGEDWCNMEELKPIAKFSSVELWDHKRESATTH